MKNKIILKIFPKTFLGTLSLITGVIIIAFLLIYFLMPKFYGSYKEDTLKTDFHQLISSIDGKRTEKIAEISNQFVLQHGYSLTISDEAGNLLHAYGTEMLVNYGNGNTTIATEVAEEIGTVTDADGRRFIVALTSSMQPIDEANTIILMVLPYVFLICFVLGAGVSFIYAKSITNPIKAISRATIDMRTLRRDASCTVRTRDEIGELAENINALYTRLLRGIDDVQREMQKVTDADREKIDFMLAVSHELKTPLTAVKGMVEGMVYNVGVYKDRDTYLARCGESIDALTTLLSEILDASRLELSPSRDDFSDTNILHLVKDIADTYEMIALSKQISIDTHIDESLTVLLPTQLFSKALSNIISNAVNYSDPSETVEIYFDDGKLIVENTCRPLSKEEVRHVFEPFYRVDSGDAVGTGHGLGLYITQRILKVCDLPFEFIPFENGMRFAVWLER